MPFGPFALQWRAPTPNPPSPSTLPPGITRTYISTPSGPLELLTALPSSNPTPSSSPPSPPPLFFAHGGFGSAAVWLSYMQFFSSHGIPCYALSYRGHGASWYPSLLRMYFTTRGAMGQDLVAGIKAVEGLETERRRAQEAVRVVLVAHSAGGALGQYVLGRGLVRVQGFCMCAAVPGFGSVSVYSFWSLSAPIHFPYRLFHPRYILATTPQVHAAFFTPETPTQLVRALERILSPYESMLWPMQTMFRFVTGGDVLASITGWGLRKARKVRAGNGDGVGTPASVPDRLLVLAAEKDVLCRPDILLDAAKRYRAAFRELVREGKVDGISSRDLRTESEREQEEDGDGVRFKVVRGLGHHLQNHEEWERGAKEILEWVETLKI
ncbi:alpha/beta-hydrolase [Melanomma pulvis-pyrius CBS 109.77]|uniref:Alpha/beta-hydrolase n=1 Tax=Melanomma pulvis-pyrius CBS 109.77 TaxID=1314802 RepID=A0A6A6XIT3_9PLEO|nr:alpha/beta-hydrolase [Melanomma pulvis-pyrius CBS 109.77]